MRRPPILLLLASLLPAAALAQGTPATPPASPATPAGAGATPAPAAATAASPSAPAAAGATGATAAPASPPRKKAPRIKYDPASVVTVSGTVLGDRDHVRRGGTKSIRLVLKVGEDQVSVHLGPEYFVESQPVQFERGDEVTVKGSKFTYSGKYGLIAQSVSRGKDTVVFRDDAGKPVWPPRPAKN